MITINNSSQINSIITSRQIKTSNILTRSKSTVSNNITIRINDFISNTSSILTNNRNHNRLTISNIHIPTHNSRRSRINHNTGSISCRSMITINNSSQINSIITSRQIKTSNILTRSKSTVSNNITIRINDFISNISSILTSNRNHYRLTISNIHIFTFNSGRSRISSDIYLIRTSCFIFITVYGSSIM